ncbi:TIM-barrel domain-containing protein [Lacrimispora indolis]|uniref:TIM-barrel domain-containing protein n=1 Tax=Lacrimispora indolis TaxID=69825 RepID=UPI0004250321|nr:glycoside hydrolase family 31 protein [[Clostridium] methoxybenzovorans]
MEQIVNGIWKLVLGEPEEKTPVSFQTVPMKTEAIHSLPVRRKAPDICREIRFEVTVRGITVTLPMETDEDIYGFGLQLKSMNHGGRKRRIRVNSDPPGDTGESHAPAPFYVSTAGYGLFADTFRYGDFYMGTNSPKGASAGKAEVNEKHEEFSESALYALKRAKEKRAIIIDIPHVKGITLYLFAGELLEVVQRYNLFSGGGCLPPMWGLGVWYRAYGGSNQEKILDIAGGLRKDGIPVDVLGLEPGWQSHSYSCTYAWSSLFPEPDRMISQLADLGYKPNCWEHAFVYPASEIYEKLLPFSGDYEVWNGLVPDFAMKEAREIFGGYHERELVDKGILGFKLDECDNSDYNPSNWSFPDSSRFPSGMDGEQMHNGIGFLYQTMILELFQKKNLRTLSQTRSSGALSAPLPFVLYSDLYDHRDFIRGMVTSGFCGMLWSPEVRSCENPEDLLRRVETVVFSAQALLNCWRIPSPPWNQVDVEKNLNGEKMDRWEYYTEVCRGYLNLRMSLLPYLYSAFMTYHREGIPPVRAVVLDFPEDSRAAVLDDQYLFGESLMICPLTIKDGTIRKVWLPNGIWHDFFTGEMIKGGQEYQVHADYDQIPVYVKDGALIPYAQPVECVREDTVFKIHVRSYGKGRSSFPLYEGDFQTFSDENSDDKIVIIRDENGKISWERHGGGSSRYESAEGIPITSS